MATKAEVRAIAETVATLAAEPTTAAMGLRPNQLAAIVAELYQRAAVSHNLAVAYCNRELTDRERARDHNNDAAMIALAARLGLAVDMSGDPLAYAMRLILPSGRSNNWGDGWGIG